MYISAAIILATVYVARALVVKVVTDLLRRDMPVTLLFPAWEVASNAPRLFSQIYKLIQVLSLCSGSRLSGPVPRDL